MEDAVVGHQSSHRDGIVVSPTTLIRAPTFTIRCPETTLDFAEGYLCRFDIIVLTFYTLIAHSSSTRPTQYQSALGIEDEQLNT